MAFPKGAPRPPDAGRKKGTPNKRTIAIREAMARAVEARPADFDSLEQMRLVAKWFLGQAAEAMKRTREVVEKGEDGKERKVLRSAPDVKLAADHLKNALSALKEIAPYEYARKASIHHTVRAVDPSLLTDEQLDTLINVLESVPSPSGLEGGEGP